MKLELIIAKKVCEVAREAGAFMKSERRNFSADKVEIKGVHDYVSYVDKASERLIVERLREILPEAGFVTEEGTVEQSDTELKWIIDPLDGTTNYIHGLSPYSVSIALVKNDTPLVGVIYVVEQDECFYAEQGRGAWLNGEPINVSSAKRLNDSLIITGFPYKHFDNMDNYMKLLEYFMKSTHGVRRLGSAAADLAYVACGRSEAFYEYGLQPWDVAAGVLLVREAGGKVTNFGGGDNCIYEKEIIASNGVVYDEFRQKVAEFLL